MGLVVALAIEIAPFLARLENVRKYKGARQTIIEGELRGKVVAVVVTGPGQKAARRGAEALIDGHRPTWLIAPGFGGALAPDLQRGDLVLPHEVVKEDGARIAIDLRVPANTENGGPRLFPGRLITVDRIIRTAKEKAELHARHGADVVDMETWAEAELAATRGVRFLPVRVVSDRADQELPPEVLSVLGQTGGYRVGAAMGALWRRPSSFWEMLTLREQAHEASRVLGAFLADVVPTL